MCVCLWGVLGGRGGWMLVYLSFELCHTGEQVVENKSLVLCQVCVCVGGGEGCVWPIFFF